MELFNTKDGVPLDEKLRRMDSLILETKSLLKLKPAKAHSDPAPMPETQRVTPTKDTKVMRITESQNIAHELMLNFALPATTAKAAMDRAKWFQKNQAAAIDILNAAGDNTIAAGVKRAAVLQTAVFALPPILAHLNVFATTFNGVRLEGTDTCVVPYYPLETAASTDFVPGTGYIIGTTNTDTRIITVNRRKYQSRGTTSTEAARQPGLVGVNLLKVKLAKLIEDVNQDILGVVTAANFGAATVTDSAAGFDVNDVGDLRKAANAAQWDKSGRGLVLNPDFDAVLFKDQRVVYTENYGSSSPIQDGSIPKILGFDYHGPAEIPENGEKLVGFAAHRSAVGVAFAPIQPAPAVMKQLETYEMFTDPRTGATIELRRYGNCQMDNEAETVEVNYGFQVLNAAGLKRICHT